MISGRRQRLFAADSPKLFSLHLFALSLYANFPTSFTRKNCFAVFGGFFKLRSVFALYVQIEVSGVILLTV